ncbi:Dyp-type peroxidase [Nonomuraea sp. NPDC050556]|uniref:Dyp-type peroxidase n=1 Tax=Nonomuraea sp. NPDC050556 TaxID=3364369 RepID=UPI003798E0F9
MTSRRTLLGAGLACLLGTACAPASGPALLTRLMVFQADRLPTGFAERLARLATGDLTAMYGLGPRLSGEIAELPAFAREHIAPECRGGDLLVQVSGSDRTALSRAATDVNALLGRRPRWVQDGFRSGRNLLGFHDPIVNPATEAEFRSEVWRPDGSTVAVVRRLRLDADRFLALTVEEQERVVGRRRDDGAPLSGGPPRGLADLHAKTPDGQWLIPADAHVRRAHALASGSGMMLRRGFTYDNGPADRGLLFVSYQRDPRTFTATQARLDEGDALMAYVTTTASGIFWVPSAVRPAVPPA